MKPKLIPPSATLLLLVLVVLLPVATLALLGVSWVLALMNDPTGQIIVRDLAIVCGALWTVTTVALVLALGLNSLGERDDQE